MGLWLDLVLLTADAAIAGIIYKLLHSNQRHIDLIMNAPKVSMDNQLAMTTSNNDHPYVCVEGVVASDKELLRSKFDDDLLGVVKTNKVYELKSKRTKGFWLDTKDLVHDTVTIVPFVLTNGEKKTKNTCKVHVADPLFADFFIDNLRETHNKFEQNTSSGMSRGIDRIFGEVTKGYEEIEAMLPLGSTLLGLGKLILDDKGELLLGRPDIDVPYIVTLLTRAEVVKSMGKRSLVYKIVLASLAVIGAGLLYVALGRVYNKYRASKREREAVQFYREMREHGAVADDMNVEDMCVVCLSAQRQVVLLDCGHICLCHACAESLPEPAHCPICRSDIVRKLPIYVP